MAMEKSGILVGVIKVSKEVSKDKLGVKRICGSCGAKFYDLGKTPIICPKCGTPYEEITSPKPSAPVAPVKEAPEVEEVALEADEAAEADDVEVIADDVGKTDTVVTAFVKTVGCMHCTLTPSIFRTSAMLDNGSTDGWFPASTTKRK